MAKILALSGSPRSGGNTDSLLAEVVKGASEAGVRTDTIYLRNLNISACTGCEQCRGTGICVHFNDGMSLIYPKIDETTGIVLGSPVYNYNISSLMKAFIDRLFPYYVINGSKPRKFSSRLAGQNRQAFVFAVGEQKNMRDMRLALPAMALPLEALGYTVLHQMIFRGFLGRGDVSADKKAMKSAHESGFRLGSNLEMAKREQIQQHV
jgi:multimeric flavodoxin WrbA